MNSLLLLYDVLNAIQNNNLFEFKEIETRIRNHNEEILSPHLYNHFNGGRCAYLLSAVLLHATEKRRYSFELARNILINVLSDIKFYEKKITWLPPEFSGTKCSLLCGNIGIVICLKIIDQIMPSPLMKDFIRKVDLSIEYDSLLPNYKRLVKPLLNNNYSNFNHKRLMSFTDYCISEDNNTLNDFLVYFLMDAQLEFSILKKIIKYKEAHINKPGQLDILSLLFLFLKIGKKLKGIKSNKFLLSKNQFSHYLVRQSLYPLFEHCGKGFVLNVIKATDWNHSLAPFFLAKLIYKKYPKKSLFLWNIIMSLKIQFDTPKHLLGFQKESIAYEKSPLEKCFNSSDEDFYRIKFFLNPDIKIFYSRFWIGTLSKNTDFKAFRNYRKQRAFATLQKNVKLSIINAKRYNKTIFWHGLSISDNKEIDLIYELLEEPKTLLEYKEKYINNREEELRLFFLLFRFAEFGLLGIGENSF